jgi:hypothetical protein
MASQAVLGGILTGGGDDQAAIACADAPRTTGASPVLQTVDAPKLEPAAPLANGSRTHSQVAGDGAQGATIAGGEHDQGALHQTLGGGWSAQQRLQPLPLLNGEHEGSGMHGDAPRDRR